jgi:hypothetical protein
VVHTWADKFSQGRLKVPDDARPGRPVQRMQELIRADRRITVDSVATALRWSHGLVHSIMHDRLKFRKVCARWVPKELKEQIKNEPNGSVLVTSLTECR